MKKSRSLIFGAVLACTAPAWAQTPAATVPPAKPPVLFPFVLPWDDASAGTITDVSFLNAKPAGVHGYIIAKQGHFVETNTGQRIRFIGTNFAAKDAFPSHSDAEKVAARIAKLGINLVRMHHMDNVDWGQDASIWDYSYKDRQHISAVQLDKLDYLVAQFKKNGIYVNLNLHVSRQFSEADGFPPSVSQISFSFDKRVDEFDRRMILLQKNYAHDLLTHVNPYTHLSYTADPAVAVVEINNENSLVGDPWATYGADLDTLPEPFHGELVGQWNNWLQKKYGTDTKLQAAWTANVTPNGPGLLTAASAWSFEHQGTSQAALKIDTLNADSSAASDAQTDITQIDGIAWHVQTHQTGLDLHNDTTYTVTFRAKADKDRTLPVAASLDEDDWHNIGLDTTAAVSADWKAFSFVFTAHDVAANHNRLAFTLGDQAGTVWISDLQIHPGAAGAGMQPGQSLAAKTVAIPVFALKVQKADWISFLADTERAYAEEMRGYLKNDLKVHANVICSQISWGGLTGLNRETNSDFADNHAYWQHPSFPHKPWDANDWNIPNTPMVSDLAAGGGTLRGLAEFRVAGKPYTISEYNHPAPNDYRAEMLPELATFAAFQDWDAFYLFDYGAYGTNAQNDKINGYFGISSDPAKTAFLPAAAMIFRAGEVTDGSSLPAVLSLPGGTDSRNADSVWKAAAGADSTPNIFTHRLSISMKGLAPARLLTTVAMPKPKSPFTLVSSTASAKLRYTVSSPDAQSVVGYVGGQTVTLGADTLTFPAFGNNFASVTLTAMDRQPSSASQKLLLTLVGKVENQNMGWNADRTSVGSQWGNGPTVVEGIPATVILKVAGPRTVWALDGTGKHVKSVPTTYTNGALTFTVGPQYQTLWYAVEK